MLQVKLTIFYLLIKLISSIHLRFSTCALKGDMVYFYGGHSDNQGYNKDVYSVKLEGLKLRNQKIQWKVEKKVEDMPNMSKSKAFVINNQSDEIFNFGGDNSAFAFNTLNVKNFKIKRNNKGLNGLLKLLNLPTGFNSSNGFIMYDFIQSDINPSKFYLLNSLTNSGMDKKLANIFIYNALEGTWKDTKLVFHTVLEPITFSYNDLIYVIEVPGVNHELNNGYIINIEKSKVIKFIPKGDVPSNKTEVYGVKNKNRLYYLAKNIGDLLFTMYILDLDTLTWKKHELDGIGFHTNPCIIYYKDHIIITFGNYQQDNEFTQIININTWAKMDGINLTKVNNSKILTDQEVNESNSDGQKDKKDEINRPALIGGLIGSGIFIGFIIVFIYIYFKRKKEISYIKPPEFITQHEIINVLDPKEDKKPLSFRFSIKSNKSKNNDDWDLKNPEAAYLFNQYEMTLNNPKLNK